MKKLIVIFVILAAAGSAAWYLKKKETSAAGSGYLFAEVTRGDIDNTISSTGTLFPVSEVEVGTQVSGTVERVYAQYNDKVRKGQILAVLDTTLLEAKVRDSEAGLLKARSQCDLAETTFARNKEMYEKKLLSESDLLTSKSQFETAKATLQSAVIELENAKTNLDHAVIRSPLNGMVVDRNVEEGQTVAASFSTPTLFKIAEDLSRMEIHALVDESDIGQIRQDQPARFSVEAYYGKQFTGTVRQIRLQPTTVQNVVNYTVVVDAANPEGLLLPGMTATVNFILEEKKDVLLVPNSALSFRPSAEVLKKLSANGGGSRAWAADSLHPWTAGAGNDPQPAQGSGKGPDRNFGRLWALDANGQLTAFPVVKGITDGTRTEIVRGKDVTEGMQVIRSMGETQAGGTTNNGNRRATGGPPMPRLF
jgi:HlyD family secretion protein